MIERIIFTDVETTSFDWRNGRILQLAGIEVIDGEVTGEHFNEYFSNEGVRIDAAATNVHGLTEDFLEAKPTFCEKADEWLAFVGDSILCGHNFKAFDLQWLNASLERCGKPTHEGNEVIDTLELSRKAFPNQSCSLDAMAERLEIEGFDRYLHDGLEDSILAFMIYAELNRLAKERNG